MFLVKPESLLFNSKGPISIFFDGNFNLLNGVGLQKEIHKSFIFLQNYTWHRGKLSCFMGYMYQQETICSQQ